MRRVQAEISNYRKFHKEMYPDIYLTLRNDDLFKQTYRFFGPPDSPFARALLSIHVDIGENYPDEAPYFYFLDVIFHLNVNQQTGQYVAGKLFHWEDSISVIDIVVELIAFLREPDQEPCSIVNSNFSELFALYKNNISLYNAKARASVLSYCAYSVFQSLWNCEDFYKDIIEKNAMKGSLLRTFLEGSKNEIKEDLVKDMITLIKNISIEYTKLDPGSGCIEYLLSLVFLQFKNDLNIEIIDSRIGMTKFSNYESLHTSSSNFSKYVFLVIDNFNTSNVRCKPKLEITLPHNGRNSTYTLHSIVFTPDIHSDECQPIFTMLGENVSTDVLCDLHNPELLIYKLSKPSYVPQLFNIMSWVIGISLPIIAIMYICYRKVPCNKYKKSLYSNK